MMRRLEGKTILVAGGGGIGGGLARRFAAEGANVVLGDVVPDDAESVVRDIVSAGQSAIATRLDGADEASANAAVALACSRFGGLDGMHTNFANFIEQDDTVGALELPLADFDEIVRLREIVCPSSK